MFAPASLPPDLLEKIASLGRDYHVSGVSSEDLYNDWATPLVPRVKIGSWYHPKHGVLACHCPNPGRSPWTERWVPEQDTDLERCLRQERSRLEEHAPERLQERRALPIAAAKDRLLATVATHSVTLVAAETGSGKSTQVPQYLLDDAIDRGVGSTCHIVCTQPRRLAAVSLATRVAWERGSCVGQAVGHIVRFAEQPPRPWGSIAFCTVGSLLARLRKFGASHIIVDEAHTRDTHTDLLLTVLIQVIRASPNLKVLVMSATCNVAKLLEHFRRHLGPDFPCDVVEASGRPHQVREYFLEDIITELAWEPQSVDRADARELPRGVWDERDCNKEFADPEGLYPHKTIEAVRSVDEHVIQLHLVTEILKWVDSKSEAGSVLVFLPGWHEIGACDALLKKEPRLRRYEIIRLHSTVPPAEQERAFWPASRGYRKVILSTDLAETSVTIPDVVCVVDIGLARVKQHTALEVQWASQANLIQRRGRAGRVRDGICVHLFTRDRFRRLDLEPIPEMQRVAIEETVLAVCDLGLDMNASREALSNFGAAAYPAEFLSLAPDPPDTDAVQRAFWELQRVGALDCVGYITHLGALLARLPLSPWQGVAMLLGALLGAPEAARRVVAALEGREPWARKKGKAEGPPPALAAFSRGKEEGSTVWSDPFVLAEAQRHFDEQSTSRLQDRFCSEQGLHPSSMHQMSSTCRQLRTHVKDMCWCGGLGPSTGLPSSSPAPAPAPASSSSSCPAAAGEGEAEWSRSAAGGAAGGGGWGWDCDQGQGQWQGQRQDQGQGQDQWHSQVQDQPHGQGQGQGQWQDQAQGQGQWQHQGQGERPDQGQGQGQAAGEEETVSQDTVLDSWPVMQLILAFASGWRIGAFEGGRKVNAGWSRPARLQKNSIFCSHEDLEGPPSELLVYAELASGSGGRVLRNATMVTPHQMLLFGGQDGPSWVPGSPEDWGSVLLDSWLEVHAEFQTASALGVLRAVTQQVLQWAAREVLNSSGSSQEACEGQCEPASSQDWNWNWNGHGDANRDWLSAWRSCVLAVARAPLPKKVSLWDVPGSWLRKPQHCEALALVPSASAGRKHQHKPWREHEGSPAVETVEQPQQGQQGEQPQQAGQTQQTQQAQPAQGQAQAQAQAQAQEEELPIGWAEHTDTQGRPFFACESTGQAQWARPTLQGTDGPARAWRHVACPDGSSKYVRQEAWWDMRERPPDVGDGQLLPDGWLCCWDAANKRHYYWRSEEPECGGTVSVTWVLPRLPSCRSGTTTGTGGTAGTVTAAAGTASSFGCDNLNLRLVSAS